MAETEVATIEINDALFCTHWKEVVSRLVIYVYQGLTAVVVVRGMQLRREGGE